MVTPDRMPILYLKGLYNLQTAEIFHFPLQNAAANDPVIYVNMDHYGFDSVEKAYIAAISATRLVGKYALIVLLLALGVAFGKGYMPIPWEYGIKPFAVLLQTINGKAGNDEGGDSQKLQSDFTHTSRTRVVSEFEQIAYRAIRLNHWLVSDMSEFTELWTNSDDQTRAAVRQSVWYQYLEFKLKREVAVLLGAGKTSDPLVIFARTLGVVGAYSNQVSVAELQASLEQLTRAYERGKMILVDALFADHVISNSGVSKDKVRQEFLELFSTSRSRKLELSNVRWEIFETHAKISGNLKLSISGHNNRPRLEAGKFQMVLKKFDNRLLLTHYYRLLD
ncbi:MAG: hypothetical protein OEZ68_02820 [Gammaproteobacteria bacterium]|nr:hypothetical protein [Gammaproteobacteria bacterium]MDH5799714.1 hypothetical protein [Gammaproteobacteria bacterium]